MSSLPHLLIFPAKNKKKYKIGNLENLMEKECFFWKKEHFHFFKILKTFLQKCEGAKNPGSSQSSCICIAWTHTKPLIESLLEEMNSRGFDGI